jgi:S-adenosylmethionine hydrolase
MPPRAANRPPIAILTDFGYRDHYAGVMRGMIATIAPEARVIDLTHGIPPQSILAGAIALSQSWRYFPPRTIFLAVVDPGVGTARAPVAIETRAGCRMVGPDNGLLWMAADAASVKQAVRLDSKRYRLQEISATFHGRDIFAPAAAHLWNGVRLSALGARLQSLARLAMPAPERSPRKLRGEVIYIDGYGNLVTNLDREAVAAFGACFPDKTVSVRIGSGAAVQILEAYGHAPKGAPLATFGSFGLLEIAVRDGNAAAHFAARPGTSVLVTVNSADSPKDGRTRRT